MTILRESWLAALKELTPEQINRALEAGQLDAVLSGQSPTASDFGGADQGARGTRASTTIEALRAELRGCTGDEVVRRLNSGEFDAALAGNA